MNNQTDTIFSLINDQLESLPIYPMRSGLFGKSLEDALHELLNRNPQLIPGTQIDPGIVDPPRFLLLVHEMPVGSWSLDHLYVDQRGILTLVETKLLENNESRRAVIGQVIEYAANATKMWTSELIKQCAIDYFSKQKKDLNQVLTGYFGDSLDIDDFWKRIGENLKDNRIRLIIASDQLRPEVRRMIEFLNGEMQNTQILGLELKCYGKDSSSLVVVPNLVGQTQANADRYSSNTSPTIWILEKLNELIKGPTSTDIGQGFIKVLGWASSNQSFIAGKSQIPSFGILGKSSHRILSFYSNEIVYLYFEDYRYIGGMKERDELVNALKVMQLLDQGLDPQQVISGRNLNRKLSDLSNDEFIKFLNILDRFYGQGKEE